MKKQNSLQSSVPFLVAPYRDALTVAVVSLLLLSIIGSRDGDLRPRVMTSHQTPSLATVRPSSVQ